jgi:hypothetical protein
MGVAFLAFAQRLDGLRDGGRGDHRHQQGDIESLEHCKSLPGLNRRKITRFVCASRGLIVKIR